MNMIPLALPQDVYEQLLQLQQERGDPSPEATLSALIQGNLSSGVAERVQVLERELASMKEQMGAVLQAIALVATRVDLMIELPVNEGEPGADS
ncbi:MAG: hypothetical protein Q6L68_06620 [Thermostichus sp. DG02_5_bins_236]